MKNKKKIDEGQNVIGGRYFKLFNIRKRIAIKEKKSKKPKQASISTDKNVVQLIFYVFIVYQPCVNPVITNIFQSAAMRIGHTMVPSGVMRRYRNIFESSVYFTIHSLGLLGK